MRYAIIKCCFLISILLSSCSDDFLFDFLLGPQPTFIDETDYNPGLSILGILRPDSLNSKPFSYVVVEKLIPAVSSSPDSFNVIDAKVVVYRMLNGEQIDSIEFLFDSTQLFPAFYRPLDFYPQAGESFSIRCEREGLPTLTAETTIPNVPVVVEGSFAITPSSVKFSIMNDSSAFLYDVHYSLGEVASFVRFVKNKSGNTQVEVFHHGTIQAGAKVAIYAYDVNLSAYLTAPNIFIKPNTYRLPFSTVYGGYGCFGSINLLVIEL